MVHLIAPHLGLAAEKCHYLGVVVGKGHCLVVKVDFLMTVLDLMVVQVVASVLASVLAFYAVGPTLLP